MRENYFNHDLPLHAPNVSNQEEPCKELMNDVSEKLSLLTIEFVWELHRKKNEIKERKKEGEKAGQK